MKFHKNSLKLAGLYLAIIMTISLFFSASIYELSTQELDRGLRRPGPIVDLQQRDLPIDLNQRFENARNASYEEAKSRVLERLVFTNLMILVAAGFLSYYLAHRTLKPIEEANDSLERFTADASHELRTPIAAMQAEIEVALMNPRLKLSETKSILKSNLEELSKLTDLSEGLLKLARVKNGRLPKQSVAIKKVLQDSTNDKKQLAEAKSIKLNIDSAKDISVLGDEPSLKELFKILIDNAIKYSPDKSEVSLSVTKTKKEALIAITDQGIGMKASEIPHIFERFYRADSSRSKDNKEGYGLGLAIAKNIVDLHQGSIDVSRNLSSGSTFSIKLPLSE